MSENLDAFVEELKEEALPGVWSKGVQYSRAVNSIEFVSKDEKADEWKFKIKTQERLLAFSVTLWLRDHDSHCNCGSKVEPCHHIVAVSLALQNGGFDFERANTAPKIEYQWKIDEKSGKIEFLRFIVSESGRTPLTQSLIGYIAGVQSGRITGKLPSSSALDLRIDEILARSHALETSTSWADLFSAVSELPPISGITVEKKSNTPSLRIVDDSHGVKLIRETRSSNHEGKKFAHGVVLEGATLKLSTTPPPFTVPESVSTSQFEKFLNEGLPQLHNYFEVVNESTVLPELVDRDPFIEYKIVEMADGRISITPSISYGLLSLKELPRRDKTQEQELMRDLRQNKHLAIGQPAYFTAEELFKKRDLAPEISQFASNYFSGLMSELGVDFKRVNLDSQAETILHLLSLKGKNGSESQIQTLARSLGNTPEIKRVEIPVHTPRALWAQLRNYQKEGVVWLSRQANAGAILADDMGLGKTVQTLAVVQTPALIVAPTSLIHNWKEESHRFRADLTVNVFHGAARRWSSSDDLTLTTYGLLSKLPPEALTSGFKTVVLDEAHLIRNEDTIAAQAAYRIPASMRIALTGTPIQNKRADLLSLFQFVSPGLFANENQMKNEVVAPFVLRRKKEDVLKELPPKTQMLHELEFTEHERKQYEATWAAAKAEIVSQLTINNAEKKSPLTMFEALLRARQACNSPTKTKYLLQMVRELTEAGHSVLVYSQWTSFLDRIEEELNLPYERLDGSTTNRGKVVSEFQNSTEAKVFLLSLHAGGVGLNLTRASHVIFCDPWWNPFVELQAEDRAYRMGQEKPVTIHRLIHENSIEEKLLKIQEHKKKEASHVLDVEASAISFTENDLKLLLTS